MFFLFIISYLSYAVFIKFYGFSNLSIMDNLAFSFNLFSSFCLSLGCLLLYNVFATTQFAQHLNLIGFDKIFYSLSYFLGFYFATNVNIITDNIFPQYSNTLVNITEINVDITLLFVFLFCCGIDYIAYFAYFFIFIYLYFFNVKKEFRTLNTLHGCFFTIIESEKPFVKF